MRPHQYSDSVVLVDPACLMASQQEYPTPALQTLHIYGNGESLSGLKSSMTGFQQASVISAEGSRLPWAAWPPPAIL